MIRSLNGLPADYKFAGAGVSKSPVTTQRSYWTVPASQTLSCYLLAFFVFSIK